MYKAILTITMGLLVSLSALTQAATYGGGSGTAESPYQIWSPQQMNDIGANPGDWGSSFRLMTDIDMSIYTGTQYNIIGNSTTKFTGTFDGNNHKISNLTYTTTAAVDYVGLFASVGSVGRVLNLGLVNIEISGRNYVGGLCGWNQGGAITSSYVTGIVTGDNIVGGLVGSNWNVILDCYTTVVINGADSVGCLAGYNIGTITKSHSSGTVTGSTYSTGGLVGRSSGLISICYASSAVSGFGDVGGLVGNNDSFGGYYDSTIESCYATGSVNGSAQVGGLVGWNEGGSIIGCYATGLANGISNIGGLCGLNSGTIADSFWDIDTSGCTASDGGIGKTTSAMKMLATFTVDGWDFVDVWGIGNGQTYPYLKLLTGINPADINYSGIVNMDDMAILAANWLKEK